MKIVKKYLPFIFVILISFWAVKPLFNSDFFPMHDDTQVARVFEMGKALGDKMLPVRWVADLGYGYGYPIFNFYAPFAYYIGGFSNLLGLNALIATKLMMLIGILLSGFFMYLLASQFWGKLGGIISAMLFIYSPYHALDIYVRGDVAEYYAYAFIPLIFYALWKIHLCKKWKYVVVGSLGYALIIISHNLTALMISPFILIFAIIISLFAYRKTNELYATRYALCVILLGLSFSAFYSVPALMEMKYTNVLSQIGGGADFRDHFVCPTQLWSSPWGFGGSAKGCADGLSFMLGKIHIVFSLLVLSLFFLLGKKIVKNNKEQLIIFLFFLFGLLISLLLTLKITKSIWETVSFLAFLQYPWRFLLLASFFSSLIGGSLVWLIDNFLKIKLKHSILIFMAFIFIILLANIKFFVPQSFIPKRVTDYVSSSAIKWIASKTSDEYMPRNFDKPESIRNIVNNKFIVDNKGGQIIGETNITQKMSATIVAFSNTKVNIKLAYFPAWKVFIDKKEVSYLAEKNGFTLFVPKGKHFIEVLFVQTPIEKISNLLTLISIIILIIGIIHIPLKKTTNENS